MSGSSPNLSFQQHLYKGREAYPIIRRAKIMADQENDPADILALLITACTLVGIPLPPDCETKLPPVPFNLWSVYLNLCVQEAITEKKCSVLEQRLLEAKTLASRLDGVDFTHSIHLYQMRAFSVIQTISGELENCWRKHNFECYCTVDVFQCIEGTHNPDEDFIGEGVSAYDSWLVATSTADSKILEESIKEANYIYSLMSFHYDNFVSVWQSIKRLPNKFKAMVWWEKIKFCAVGLLDHYNIISSMKPKSFVSQMLIDVPWILGEIIKYANHGIAEYAEIAEYSTNTYNALVASYAASRIGRGRAPIRTPRQPV